VVPLRALLLLQLRAPVLDLVQTLHEPKKLPPITTVDVVKAVALEPMAELFNVAPPAGLVGLLRRLLPPEEKRLADQLPVVPRGSVRLAPLPGLTSEGNGVVLRRGRRS
jgi:hypothetical protein